MPSRIASDLAQLARLARDGGLDLRQVALRVKTDLLLTAANPSAEDMQAFQDMAVTLIPMVDEATAVILARKLASWPRVPREVLASLRARGGAVLAALVQYGMPLSPAEFEEIAGRGGEDARLALAGRRDLTATASLILAEHGERAIDLTLAANSHSALPRAGLDLLVRRAGNDPALGLQLLARSDLPAAELTPLFLLAAPERQQAMVDATASHEALTQSGRATPLAPDHLAGLIATAKVDRSEAFSALASAFGLGEDYAEALAGDHSRQLAALTLIGLGATAEDATRFLIGLGDDAAFSVTRIFALVALMRSVTPAVARRLALQIGGVSRPTGRQAALQPVMDPSGTPVRAGGDRLTGRAGLNEILRKLGRQAG